MATHPLICIIAQGSLTARANRRKLRWFLNRQPDDFDAPYWADLRRQFHDGDELWKFRTNEESWERHMGWEGFALVREGEVIGAVVTRQN